MMSIIFYALHSINQNAQYFKLRIKKPCRNVILLLLIIIVVL